MARGSIRERSGPTGTAWQVRVYGGIDPATGRQRQLARTIRGTRKEAEAALNRLLTEVDDGAHTGPDAPLRDLLHQWANVKATRWSPKTLLETRGNITRWIAPDDTHPERRRRSPGDTPVRKITAAQLDAWYAWLTTQLAPPTVRRIHGIVHAALEQAVRWDWILRNPASHTEPIAGQPREIHPPDPTQVAALLTHLAANEPEVAVLVRLAAITGRRRGELAALRWTDFDLEAGTVTVTRTLADSASDGWVERPITKNRARTPPLAIDPVTVAMLKAHRLAVRAALLTVGLQLSDDGHVFVRVMPGATGIAPWSPDGISRRFSRVRADLGLDGVRLHDLRHYVATS